MLVHLVMTVCERSFFQPMTHSLCVSTERNVSGDITAVTQLSSIITRLQERDLTVLPRMPDQTGLRMVRIKPNLSLLILNAPRVTKAGGVLRNTSSAGGEVICEI